MSSPVIALQVNARYHRHIRTGARAMSDGTAAEIEHRLNEGAWLRPGEVATLFGKSRWAVIGWIKNGYRTGSERITIHYRETGGGHRELDPDDVQKALAAFRVRRSGRKVEPETPPTDG